MQDSRRVTLEVVVVNSLQRIRLSGRNANPKVHHQTHERLPIDQNDALFNLFDIGSGVRRELGRRNNNTFPCTMALKTARESLHHGSTYGRLPPLSLNINNVETKPVFID